MTHDPAWREELIRLGGSIHQDSEPELSEDEDATQQVGSSGTTNCWTS
ncbi:MAG: hypothetical protein QM804_02285 [Propionicimonas sp.]